MALGKGHTPPVSGPMPPLGRQCYCTDLCTPVDVTANTKGIRLWTLDVSFVKHVGSPKESACTSLSPWWMLGTNGVLVVNLPALKKTKKPSQLAAQSMTWSLEYRFREHLITCMISIVVGRRLRVEEPCTCLIPHRRRWSCKQLIRRSGNPLSMWRNCTALRYTLKHEWLRLLLLLPLWPSKSMPRFLSANNVAKWMRICLSPWRTAPSGLRRSSWWQKST